MSTHHSSKRADLGLTFVRSVTPSSQPINLLLEIYGESYGGQDARQGWDWLSAEQGRALGRWSQQRRPGFREYNRGWEGDCIRERGP